MKSYGFTFSLNFVNFNTAWHQTTSFNFSFLLLVPWFKHLVHNHQRSPELCILTFLLIVVSAIRTHQERTVLIRQWDHPLPHQNLQTTSAQRSHTVFIYVNKEMSTSKQELSGTLRTLMFLCICNAAWNAEHNLEMSHRDFWTDRNVISYK